MKYDIYIYIFCNLPQKIARSYKDRINGFLNSV